MAIGEAIRPSVIRDDEGAVQSGGAADRWTWLFQPVPIDSLVYFRIGFAAIMLWEVWRYLTAGWIAESYIEPVFHFTYYGFDWVRPWPGNGMYYHFAALGVCAACMLVGFAYRLAAAGFWLGFTYFFLLDQANYLNHFYLVCLVSFAMIFVPAARACSIDAWLRPRLARATAPRWTVWLVAAHICIAYFYGGIAKLNMDWLTGNPMRMMLASAQDFPLIGRFFLNEAVVLLFAYSGLLLDLLIVPLLIWKRTRLPALIAAAVFHLSNDMLFSIGIFPWFMLFGTLVFFPPTKLTPLRLCRILAGVVYAYANLRMLNSDWREHHAAHYLLFAAGMALLPLIVWKKTRLVAFCLACALQLACGFGLLARWEIFGGLHPVLLVLAGFLVFPPDWLVRWRITPERPDDETAPPAQHAWNRQLVLGGLAVYMGVQLLLPFRHWLYPGNVNWTEEGHLFSWHMKLRYKSGFTSFIAFDARDNPLPHLGAGGYLLFEIDDQGRRSHVLDANGKRVYRILQADQTDFRQSAPDGEWIEVDDRGNPLYELNAEAQRAYTLDAQGRRLHPIGRRDGHVLVLDPRDRDMILFELNPDGSRNVVIDHEGRALYELDAYGSPVYELDENGGRLFPLNGFGRRVIPEEKGRPIPELVELNRERAAAPLPFLLTPRQRDKASGRPDMILQYAHFLGKILKQQGAHVAAVRTQAMVSLNAREFQPLIDPRVNLLNEARSLAHKRWIVPLDPNSPPGVRLQRARERGELDAFPE